MSFLCFATYCILNTMPVYMRDIQVLQDWNLTYEARHCTEWGHFAAQAHGYRYKGRQWNGWLKLSGPALTEEIAPMIELRRVRPGWMVEFVNNNEFNGRHAGIITHVHSHGTVGITADVMSYNRKRGVHTKTYRFVSREAGRQSSEKYATTGVPVIATYRPE